MKGLWIVFGTLPVWLTAAPVSSRGDITFSRDVAPILYKHCAGCHHPDDVAPMSLLSYKEARPWAAAMSEAVRTRKMPPWQADPRYGHFENDPRLTEHEISTLVSWSKTGAKEGNPADAPPQPTFPDGWNIGKPDLIIPIPEGRTIKANSPDDYVYFKVPTNFAEDKWVTAVELRPGNRQVVHHAHVNYLRHLETKPMSKEELAVRIREGGTFRLNPAVPVLDDGCSKPSGGDWPGGAFNEEESRLGSYLPGRKPDVFAPGYARKIPAGAILQFQIHYNGTFIKQDEIDRTSVGFVFAKEPPVHQVRQFDVSNHVFLIPAGDPAHKVTACYLLDRDIDLMSYTAHMHFRGKDAQVVAEHPDGRREILVSILKYDFNWQSEYKFAEPVPLEKGTRIAVITHYDNSPNNKFNPDPQKDIRWGQPSHDEMDDNYFKYILPQADAQK